MISEICDSNYLLFKITDGFAQRLVRRNQVVGWRGGGAPSLAADHLASFWDRAYAEFNVANAMAGGAASQGSAWAGLCIMAS